MIQRFRFFIPSLFLISALLVVSACHQEEDVQPYGNSDLNKLEFKPKTPYFAQFFLSHFNENPLGIPSLKVKNSERNYWENSQPFSIQSGGSSYLCEPFLDNETSYLAFSITASEAIPENTKPPYYKRQLEILVPFTPRAFETQEKFYGLLTEGKYEFGKSFVDFGSFVVYYSVGDKVYSSLNVNNDAYEIKVSNLVKVLPQFEHAPEGNNGLPASVEATFTFSGLLKSQDEEYLLVENAILRGKYYRQNPPGHYWSDWGKGWGLNK